MDIFFNRTDPKSSALKSQFINKVLSGDFNSTVDISSNLEVENPFYSAISIILNKDQKKLEKYLEMNKIEIDFVLYLIQQDMCVEFTVKYLNNLKIKDYLYYICLKELLIKNVIDIDPDKLLDRIDDFGIYQYCIDNKITPRPRDSINYQYYKLHIKNFESLDDLLLKVKVYKDLEYLVEISGVLGHPDYFVNEIIKFIKTGFNEEFLKDNIDKADIPIVKLVLAHLITSRDIRNLILALYIARKHAFSVLENYEIDLIYLFLVKYFLFNWDVLDIYKRLDIKNNQMLNMSFIWSDVYLNLMNSKKIYNHEMKNKFGEYISDLKTTIISKLPNFIDDNKISYALNLIELYKKIEENIVYKELENGNFINETSKDFSQFKGFLGSRCDYLFEKNTKFYSINYPENLFNNNIMTIKDEDFIQWFLKNKKLYN